jgi:hypothetical protein
MDRLIRLVMLFLLGPLLYSFVREGLLLIASITDWQSLRWCGLGILVYVILEVLLPHNFVIFFETLEHELAHAAMGVLTFHPVGGIEVSTKGAGKTSVMNPNAPIYLAPYFPLFTAPLLLIRPFLSPASTEVLVVDLLIGFTLACHYSGLLREFSPRQPDIAETGLLFSIGMAVVLNLVFLVIALCVVLNDYSRILDYFTVALTRTPEYYMTVLSQLSRLI